MNSHTPIIIIFLFSSFITLSLCSIDINVPISIPMSTEPSLQRGKHYYTIQIKIGTPPQSFNVQLDTSVSTSWIPSSKCKNCIKSTSLYNSANSSSSSPTDNEVELEDENGDSTGYAIKDTIDVNGYQLHQFGFVEVTEIDDYFKDHYDGKIGLGYRGELGHDFNFIEKLKFDNIIQNRIFTINQINSSYGLFHIGDIPIEQKYPFCNLTYTEDLDDEFRESWVCHLTHVGISINTTKDIKLSKTKETKFGRVAFDSAYDYIGVPKRDWDIINETLLHNFSCSHYSSEIDDEDKYICAKAEIDPKLVMVFVLQGNAFEIPVKELFIDNNSTMEFLLRCSNEDDGVWNFGYPFMSRFLVIFNMEERHIGIFSNNASGSYVSLEKEWNDWFKVKINNRKKFNQMLMIGIAILALILIVIIICCIIRCVRKKALEESKPIIREEENHNADNFD